jgi:hypothetical protein
MGQHYTEHLENALARETMEKNKLEIQYNELKEKHERTQWLVNQILFDKGAFPFICGTMGESDQNGMYDYFSICPAYGSDATYTYRKVK